MTTRTQPVDDVGWNDPRLRSCGCLPGFFLCPEAVVLWQRAADVLRETGRWHGYMQARADYDAHVYVAEEAA